MTAPDPAQVAWVIVALLIAGLLGVATKRDMEQRALQRTQLGALIAQSQRRATKADVEAVRREFDVSVARVLAALADRAAKEGP